MARWVGADGEQAARDRRMFMSAKMSAKMKALGIALEDQLRKELGQDVKPILAKIDRMLAQGKKRTEIEKTMTAEIIKCMDKRMKQLWRLPT
jgi:hypothetical protein